MQTLSFIKDLIWRFFIEAPTDNEQERLDSLPKSIGVRTKDYKIRKFEIHEFSDWGKESHNLLIPVTNADFGPLDPQDYIEPFNMRAKMLDSDDRCAYIIEIPKYIKKGVVEVYAKAIEFGLIEISKVIQEGDRGDSDGYGVEPDTWIVAYLNSKGEFVSPFSLCNSRSDQNIKNQLIACINPVDKKGIVKICPFDKVEKAFRLPGYFHVQVGERWGLADKYLQIIIPLEYKMLHSDGNGLVWVRLNNNLCGILNLENRFKIPPEYEYLSCIDQGYLKGYYHATKNGRSGIIDRDNHIISGFDDISK